VLFAFTQAAQDVQAKYEAERAAIGSGQLLHPAERGIRVLATFHIPLEKQPQAMRPGDEVWPV